MYTKILLLTILLNLFPASITQCSSHIYRSITAGVVVNVFLAAASNNTNDAAVVSNTTATHNEEKESDTHSTHHREEEDGKTHHINWNYKLGRKRNLPFLFGKVLLALTYCSLLFMMFFNPGNNYKHFNAASFNHSFAAIAICMTDFSKEYKTRTPCLADTNNNTFGWTMKSLYR